jgi:SAM-dependent methyltransferase
MARLDSPSAQRNKEPIWGVLSTKVLPLLLKEEDVNLNILEIAAGVGVHTEYFALELVGEIPSFQWFPTDPDEASRASIEAHISDARLASLVRDPLPLTLDKNGIMEPSTVSALPDLDVIICINMIHISPWEATIGLMKTASQKLRKGGILLCYGPYKEGGTAVESNM